MAKRRVGHSVLEQQLHRLAGPETREGQAFEERVKAYLDSAPGLAGTMKAEAQAFLYGDPAQGVHHGLLGPTEDDDA